MALGPLALTPFPTFRCSSPVATGGLEVRKTQIQPPTPHFYDCVSSLPPQSSSPDFASPAAVPSGGVELRPTYYDHKQFMKEFILAYSSEGKSVMVREAWQQVA